MLRPSPPTRAVGSGAAPSVAVATMPLARRRAAPIARAGEPLGSQGAEAGRRLLKRSETETGSFLPCLRGRRRSVLERATPRRPVFFLFSCFGAARRTLPSPTLLAHPLLSSLSTPCFSPHTEKLQPFDEGAAQVARLLARDKRELLGDGADVADFVAASEFAEDAPTTTTTPSTTTTASTTTAASATPVSPFGAPPPASPFGGIGFGTGSGAGAGSNPMAGLGSDGAPLFTEAEDFSKPSASGGGGFGGGGASGGPAPWYAGITLTQVVIALSFVLVILAMLATFAFVFRVGAIHFNE
jgi:hypothetical protein